jgi:hypothetical protein
MRKPGYTVLGFAVWQGGKLYLRRRYGDKPRNIAAAGLIVIALAVLIAAGRRTAS